MEQNGWGPPAVDLNFLKSGLGVLKIVQMVLSLAGFIVAEITASPYNWEQMKAFEWISLIIFILTLAVFTIFLASWHKSEAVIRVNWPLVDFCHSSLCTVLWSLNLILAVAVVANYGPGMLVGAIIAMILAIISLLTFWATVRMSYRRWHLFSPTPTIPYHYQHLGTEPYS
ncbi:CKLF-like MARVEL transmembrane domain-containing protein 4 isoform X5 [Branchiostoma lanceolatum]|uniref:CKLF-like MARVEL transmembrane domain-containing protein 4 isoform X5 n=1 Tax=Branchiostoma lanceolatum TaxID=7740 RepID=UPI003456FB9D